MKMVKRNRWRRYESRAEGSHLRAHIQLGQHRARQESDTKRQDALLEGGPAALAHLGARVRLRVGHEAAVALRARARRQRKALCVDAPVVQEERERWTHPHGAVGLVEPGDDLHPAELPLAAGRDPDARRPEPAVHALPIAVQERERGAHVQEAVHLALVGRVVEVEREARDGLGDEPHARVRLGAVEEPEDVGVAQGAQLAEGGAREREQGAAVVGRDVRRRREVEREDRDGRLVVLRGCRVSAYVWSGPE